MSKSLLILELERYYADLEHTIANLDESFKECLESAELAPDEKFHMVGLLEGLEKTLCDIEDMRDALLERE